MRVRAAALLSSRQGSFERERTCLSGIPSGSGRAMSDTQALHLPPASMNNMQPPTPLPAAAVSLRINAGKTTTDDGPRGRRGNAAAPGNKAKLTSKSNIDGELKTNKQIKQFQPARLISGFIRFPSPPFYFFLSFPILLIPCCFPPVFPTRCTCWLAPASSPWRQHFAKVRAAAAAAGQSR